VFAGTKGQPLSDMSLTAVIRRMNGEEKPVWADANGEGITVHGFRSSFRMWAAETTNYPREVAEHALAHQLPDAVERAYQRGSQFAKRAALMGEWAVYCSTVHVYSRHRAIETARLATDKKGTKVVFPKHLIHHRPHSVDILIADLHENRAGLGQQIPRHGQPIAQVGQVAVDPVAPRIAKRLHLLRLARDVPGIAVLHVAAGGGPLEVAVELDPVRRIEVDALHLAAQPLALGQAGHDLQRVAEDHAVAPVLVVLVEIGLVGALGDAVEIGEEIGW
jgi:hypothetical protein